MKTKIVAFLHLCALAGALTLLPACAFQSAPVAVQPVGPAPDQTAGKTHDGYLVVYSAWGLVNENKAPVDHHSRYTITSDDGKMNRVIINHIDRFDEGPIHLPLAPASYKVKALSAHSGMVIVPVIIKPDQITYIYLDGQARPKPTEQSQTDFVRLPDGQVVGWAATR
jgi:hypothetical protein